MRITQSGKLIPRGILHINTQSVYTTIYRILIIYINRCYCAVLNFLSQRLIEQRSKRQKDAQIVLAALMVAFLSREEMVVAEAKSIMRTPDPILLQRMWTQVSFHHSLMAVSADHHQLTCRVGLHLFRQVRTSFEEAPRHLHRTGMGLRHQVKITVEDLQRDTQAMQDNNTIMESSIALLTDYTTITKTLIIVVTVDSWLADTNT